MPDAEIIRSYRIVVFAILYCLLDLGCSESNSMFGCQCVVVDGSFSNYADVESGVPQGKF